MLTKSNSRITSNLFGAFVLVALGLISIACNAVGEDQWVMLNTEKSDQPEEVYFVLEERSPWDDPDEEDPEGLDRECLLLPFDKQTTKDPHGKHHYYSRTIDQAYWQPCEPYASADKPPLVINSIPDGLHEQLGVEEPDFFLKK